MYRIALDAMGGDGGLVPNVMGALTAVAEQEGVTTDQFIGMAVAEKIATLRTVNYLAERAKRGTPPGVPRSDQSRGPDRDLSRAGP